MDELEWNVYRYDINYKKMKVFNIFEHGGFSTDFHKLCNKDNNEEDFADKLKRILLYYYWSKSEHEIIIFPWLGDRDTGQKIDIYSQVMINWEHFLNYCWNYYCGGEN